MSRRVAACLAPPLAPLFAQRSSPSALTASLSPTLPAGESIPIRLFLGGFDALTPTFRNVNNKFSVKYFLNLVLIDEEDRRYFKQQEITLFRK